MLYQNINSKLYVHTYYIGCRYKYNTIYISGQENNRLAQKTVARAEYTYIYLALIICEYLDSKFALESAHKTTQCLS